MVARTYKRDRNGRFSSTGGGGGGARPKVTGGTLAARSSLKGSRQKLAAKGTSAQKGAVTRASRKLSAQQQANTVKLQGLRKGVIAKPRGLQPGAIKTKAAANKPAGRKVNAKAQRAKEMANRSGVAPGKRFTHGQDVRTESLRELRSAVRQNLRGMGVSSRKEFLMQALAAGISKPNAKGIAEGRMPKTRGDWEKMHKALIGMPQSSRNNKARPGIVNGVDIHRDFRPWAVFGLNPKTASREDVNRAYRRVSMQVHPDAGGRRRDFERVKKMRDSVLALMPQPKAAKPRRSSSRRRGTATARTAGGRAMLPGGR